MCEGLALIARATDYALIALLVDKWLDFIWDSDFCVLRVLQCGVAGSREGCRVSSRGQVSDDAVVSIPLKCVRS